MDLSAKNNDDDGFDANDRAALQLSIDLTLAEDDEASVEQVKTMLAEREWDDVAHSCCYHRQYSALNLLPWQSPPCWVDDPDQDLSTPQHPTEGRHEAAMLTKRMLALSRNFILIRLRRSKRHRKPSAETEGD
jgi:hypothetical protein